MRAIAALLCAATVACSIPRLEDAPAVTNECASNVDCGASGVCIDAMCVATNAELPRVLLEIDAPYAADGQRLGAIVDLAAQGLSLEGDMPLGHVHELSLVPQVADVTASFVLESAFGGCTAMPVPFALELFPALDVTGIPLLPYAAESSEAPGATPSLRVPHGTYDIYARATLPEETPSECQIPPILLRSRVLASQSVDIQLAVKSSPTELTGSIDADLSDWTIALIDNQDGRLLSTPARLESEPSPVGSTTFSLYAWPEVFAPNSFDTVLKMTPPEEQRIQGKPTLLWKLEAIQPGSIPHVELKTLGLLDQPATLIEGSVIAPNGAGVPATVAIRSNSLDAEAGSIAAFQTIVVTDSDGWFSVKLRPGLYEVVAAPAAGSDLAITRTDWTIAVGDLGGGRSVELSLRPRLIGHATLESGLPALFTAVFAEPAATHATTYLEEEFDVRASPVASLGGSTDTDASGYFELPIDPGQFDFSLRPAPGSRLPWLVRPRVAVSDAGPYAADLGDITITHPVVLHGAIAAPDGPPIAHGAVRIWLAPSTDVGAAAPAAVLLAETHTDDAGAFSLLLPSGVSE